MTKDCFRHSSFGIRHCRQASGLVLRRPVTRSPSFHWPRFLSKATRSKRFRVFRFAPRVLEARKLLCSAIKSISPSVIRPFPRAEPGVVSRDTGVRQRLFWRMGMLNCTHLDTVFDGECGPPEPRNPDILVGRSRGFSASRSQPVGQPQPGGIGTRPDHFGQTQPRMLRCGCSAGPVNSPARKTSAPIFPGRDNSARCNELRSAHRCPAPARSRSNPRPAPACTRPDCTGRP